MSTHMKGTLVFPPSSNRLQMPGTDPMVLAPEPVSRAPALPPKLAVFIEILIPAILSSAYFMYLSLSIARQQRRPELPLRLRGVLVACRHSIHRCWALEEARLALPPNTSACCGTSWVVPGRKEASTAGPGLGSGILPADPLPCTPRRGGGSTFPPHIFAHFFVLSLHIFLRPGKPIPHSAPNSSNGSAVRCLLLSRP